MKKLAAMFTASQEELREDLEGNTWMAEDTLIPEELQTIEQAHDDVNEAHDDVETAVDVISNLEETRALSQEALDSGNAGLSIKIAMHGINATYRRVGLESIDLNPSVEEGGGLKQVAKAAWDTLVKALKAAWDKIKALYAHVSTFIKSLFVNQKEVEAELDKVPKDAKAVVVIGSGEGKSSERSIDDILHDISAGIAKRKEAREQAEKALPIWGNFESVPLAYDNEIGELITNFALFSITGIVPKSRAELDAEAAKKLIRGVTPLLDDVKTMNASIDKITAKVKELNAEATRLMNAGLHKDADDVIKRTRVLVAVQAKYCEAVNKQTKENVAFAHVVISKVKTAFSKWDPMTGLMKRKQPATLTKVK